MTGSFENTGPLSLTGVALLLAGTTACFAQDRDIFETPPLSFYGLPGLIDMPSAAAMPDGELATTISSFAGTTRYQLAAQFHPRISGVFRYSQVNDFDAAGFDTYYDRSFDLRFTLLTENLMRPEVAIGLRDFIGTGIYGAEYIVATKTLTPQLTVTGGLGWGRLSGNDIWSGVGDRPTVTPATVADGGEANFDSLFRGPVGFFGGVQWRPLEDVAFKVEYSSDDYTLEDDELGIIERKSPFNFGIEYEPADGVQLGGYYLYGSQFGVRLSFTFNPNEPVAGGSLDAGSSAGCASSTSGDRAAGLFHRVVAKRFQRTRHPRSSGSGFGGAAPWHGGIDPHLDHCDAVFAQHRVSGGAAGMGRAAGP